MRQSDIVRISDAAQHRKWARFDLWSDIIAWPLVWCAVPVAFTAIMYVMAGLTGKG